VRALRWMAACVLLVLLIFGVGSVMAFVLGQARPMALSVDAALLAMSWHGLRRIDPSGSGERPPEDWGTAILVTVVVAAMMIGGLVWTPWLTIFAAIVFRSGGSTGVRQEWPAVALTFAFACLRHSRIAVMGGVPLAL
jgi:hypothetical protein